MFRVGCMMFCIFLKKRYKSARDNNGLQGGFLPKISPIWEEEPVYCYAALPFSKSIV